MPASRSVRYAAASDVLIDTMTLNKAERRRRIDHLAEVLQQTQQHNAAARRSHGKARRRRLRKLGIRVERLQSCLPP